MAEEYDIILDAKKRVNEPNNPSFEQAKAASEAGKLKLVKEMILEPYTGKGFELEQLYSSNAWYALSSMVGNTGKDRSF